MIVDKGFDRQLQTRRFNAFDIIVNLDNFNMIKVFEG